MVHPSSNDLADRFPVRLSAFWEDAPEGLEELSRVISHKPS